MFAQLPPRTAVAAVLFLSVLIDSASGQQPQWERIGRGLATPPGEMYSGPITAMCIDPVGSIYAAVPRDVTIGDMTFDIGGAAYRSDDAGASWIRIRDTASTVVSLIPGIVFATQMSIVGGETSFEIKERFDLSRDNGATWETVFDTYPRHVSVSPSGAILIGTTSELRVSTDTFRTWTTSEFPLGAWCTTFTPTGALLASVSQSTSNGDLLMRSTDNGATWTALADTFQIEQLTAVESGTVFMVGAPRDAGVLAGKALYRSTDDGISWTGVALDSFRTPVMMACPYRDVLFLTESQQPTLVSIDDGLTWRTRGSSGTSRVARDSSGGLLTILFGQNQWSGIYRSIDTGSVWRYITEGIERPDDPSRFWIGSYGVHPSGTMVVATSTGLWHSVGTAAVDDASMTFTDAELRVTPHPVGDGAAVSLGLSVPSTVELTLLDALGRVARMKNAGTLPAGEHVVRLDTRGLPAGAYVLRCSADGRSIARTIVVAR